MTPAIIVAQKMHIAHKVHSYDHDPASEAYGMEAVEKLGVDAARVFKTLVVRLDTNKLAVAVIPVSSMLSMKHFARAVGAKKASMAMPQDVERSTGYVLGGVSPLGQKKQLTTIIDRSAMNFSTIYVSAGRRGLEIELSPDDLKKPLMGHFADLCQ